MKESKLGRSFGELLEENEIAFNENEEVVELEIDIIKPNPNQPRIHFDKASLKELAESIKEHGIIQPVIVKPSQDYYVLVAGERRVKAAELAGLDTVPAIIRDYNSIFLAELAILENLQREDLTPIEEAMALSKALDNLQLTHEELGRKIGKSRVYVTNMVGLLHLPASVMADVNSGKLSMGHARALSKIRNTTLLAELHKRTIDENLTVRDLEKIIHDSTSKHKTYISKQKLSQYSKELGEVVTEKIAYKLTNSSIQFTFKSEKELKQILAFLKKE